MASLSGVHTHMNIRSECRGGWTTERSLSFLPVSHQMGHNWMHTHTQTHINVHRDSTTGEFWCNPIHHTLRTSTENKPSERWTSLIPLFFHHLNYNLCQPGADRNASRCDTNSWKTSVLLMAFCRPRSPERVAASRFVPCSVQCSHVHTAETTFSSRKHTHTHTPGSLVSKTGF